ncbi:CoA transferase [Nocardia thailandica]
MSSPSALVHAYESGCGAPASEPAEIPDPGGLLAATLPVWALAAGSVAAVGAAANRVRAAQGLDPRPVRVDPGRVAGAFASERVLRIDGAPPAAFAELSGFFPAADGWVRTHANYPHHRDRLLAVLGLPRGADAAAARARFAARPAAELEDAAAAAGALIFRVRTEQEWAASPAGTAACGGPLIAVEPRTPDGRGGFSRDATAERPLAGVRVLDLTRVLAGPVATRTLALLGAEVLRIDPPAMPEIAWQYLDNCQGKRSALLDLRGGLAAFTALLAEADVLVTGYRPGALEALGVAADRPGLVHARLCAWGESGPWGGRRGFDSLVQAASGIALLEGTDGAPGALPAQALDHASGYLLAAGILDALRARAEDGRGRTVRAALARTAAWLLAAGGRTPGHGPATPPYAAATVTHGPVVGARPAVPGYDDYPWPAPPYGADPAAWR